MTTALRTRGLRQLRSGGPAALALCAFVALATVQILVCRRYPTDYDEGVYLQTLRAVADGFTPYRDVFLSQPPEFVDAVMPFFRAFGEGIVAGRLAMLAFWAAAIAGIYAVGTLLSSKRAGLLAAGLLVLDPLFLAAGRTLQPEVVALALAVWSVAAGLYAARQSRPPARRAAAIVCGALWALATATKFLAAPVLVPLVVIAIRSRDRKAVLAATGGALAMAALLAAPLIDAMSAAFSQTVRFHQVAAARYGHDVHARVEVWLTALNDPLVALGCLTFALIAVRRWRQNSLALSWFGATAGSLLLLAPLWEHHFAALAPPAALLISTVVADLPRWSKQCAAVLLCAMAVAAGQSSVEAYTAKDPYPHWVMAELHRVTAGERYVVTDDQFLASTLGLRVPPELTDTSLVRIETGYLSLDQVTRAMSRHEARVVILTSGRLAQVPGYTAWLRASCTPVAGLMIARVLSCREP